MSGLESTPSQRWLARLSFVLAGLAIVILVVFAGLKSLAILAVGLAPRGRPGIPAPKPPKDWARLRYLAGIPRTAPTAPDDREWAPHGDRTVQLQGTLRSDHRFEWR